jgi:hypothetical protein
MDTNNSFTNMSGSPGLPGSPGAAGQPGAAVTGSNTNVTNVGDSAALMSQGQAAGMSEADLQALLNAVDAAQLLGLKDLLPNSLVVGDWFLG